MISAWWIRIRPDRQIYGKWKFHIIDLIKMKVSLDAYYGVN
jgi:hypothetical protein